MWPFTRTADLKPKPQICFRDIVVHWNDDGYWEFSDEQFDYVLYESPRFDVALFEKLPLVPTWLEQLNAEIDEAIRQQLIGYAEFADNWDDFTKKELLNIDPSLLVERNQIEATFVHPDGMWGDLQIDIFITNGQITEVGAGD